MMPQVIRTENAPVPTGPFNQGMRVGNLVFTSGQAGRNRETGEMGGLGEQTDWALRNIEGILAEAGATLANVVKATIFVKEGTPTGPLNDVWKQRFPEPRPPRSAVFVSHLKNPEMLVEIEVVAVLE